MSNTDSTSSEDDQEYFKRDEIPQFGNLFDDIDEFWKHATPNHTNRRTPQQSSNTNSKQRKTQLTQSPIYVGSSTDSTPIREQSSNLFSNQNKLVISPIKSSQKSVETNSTSSSESSDYYSDDVTFTSAPLIETPNSPQKSNLHDEQISLPDFTSSQSDNEETSNQVPTRKISSIVNQKKTILTELSPSPIQSSPENIIRPYQNSSYKSPNRKPLPLSELKKNDKIFSSEDEIDKSVTSPFNQPIVLDAIDHDSSSDENNISNQNLSPKAKPSKKSQKGIKNESNEDQLTTKKSKTSKKDENTANRKSKLTTKEETTNKSNSNVESKSEQAKRSKTNSNQTKNEPAKRNKSNSNEAKSEAIKRSKTKSNENKNEQAKQSKAKSSETKNERIKRTNDNKSELIKKSKNKKTEEKKTVENKRTTKKTKSTKDETVIENDSSPRKPKTNETKQKTIKKSKSVKKYDFSINSDDENADKQISDLIQIRSEKTDLDDDDLPIALRRSKRVIVKPLKFWKGERIVYGLSENNMFSFKTVALADKQLGKNEYRVKPTEIKKIAPKNYDRKIIHVDGDGTVVFTDSAYKLKETKEVLVQKGKECAVTCRSDKIPLIFKMIKI